MRVFYKPRKNGTYLYIKTFSNKQQNYAEERKKDGGWVKEGQRKWERKWETKWEEMFILFKMREKMRERENERIWRKKSLTGNLKRNKMNQREMK